MPDSLWVMAGSTPRHIGGKGTYTTASRLRPLALLRLRTARPPLVAIRTRNPWVRFFFVLLKFVSVFFIVWTPVEINKLSHKPHRDSFVKANMGLANGLTGGRASRYRGSR